METLDLKFALTLNNLVVPVVQKDMHFIDPYAIAGDLDMDLENSKNISIVNFKATADMHWFEKTLGFKEKRWWVHNHCKIPLLLEIREAIQNKKPKAGSTARMPREAGSMVFVRVRDRLLCVQNITNLVMLGLIGSPGASPGTPEDQVAVLKWFLNELRMDIENLETTQHSVVHKKATKHSVEEPEEDIMNEIIETIQDHPQCLRVCFAPSRRSFKVVKKDKSSYEAGVKRPAKRKHGEEEVRAQYQQALGAVVAWLDALVQEMLFLLLMPLVQENL